MDETSLLRLLAIEKSLYHKEHLRTHENNPSSDEEALDHGYRECSESALQVYWKMNQEVEVQLACSTKQVLFRLRHAVVNNNLLYVAICLRHMGDPNIMDDNQQSLIHLCTTAAMIQLLLGYGANLHHLASSGRTALHNCSTPEAADALILAGISPNVLNRSRGTPLHSGFLTTGVTRVLLKHGADPNILNYYEHTPLHLVASRGTWEVVYYLLCGGCDCSVVGRDGMSALSLARMVRSDVLRGENISVPNQEFVRLDKTIELLLRWQESIQAGKTFAQTKYAVSKYFSWKAQELLCKDPLSGYREAMQNKVPEDVINEIIVHFVGPEGPCTNTYSKFNRMSSFRRLEENQSFSSRMKSYPPIADLLEMFPGIHINSVYVVVALILCLACVHMSISSFYFY